MADLNEELLRLLDGPGPIHINQDDKPDWNRGSDGAQHVKIVDQNGNPISTQNVKDADVKAELESVKAELQSLKEHTFNTQLTGSSVALKISEMEETVSNNRVGNLPAGSSEIVVDIEQPCILESLMLGTDKNNIIVRVQNRKHDGSYETGMRLVSIKGDYSVPVMPAQLNTIGGENDYWREFVYNQERNEFA